MEEDIQLNISDVYWGTGPVYYEFSTPRLEEWFSDPIRGSFSGSQNGVLTLAWSTAVPYLNIRSAEVIHPADRQGKSPSKTEFVRDRNKVLELLRNYTGSSPKLGSSAPLIGAIVRPEDSVKMAFVIDTNHPTILNYLNRQDENSPDLSPIVHCYLILRSTDEQKKEPIVFRKRIRLTLKPTEYARPFGGVVAVDLGNTNTTLAAVSVDQEPQASRVLICPEIMFGEDNPQSYSFSRSADFIPSVLRIYSVTDTTSPEAQKWAEQLGLADPAELHGMVEGYTFAIGKAAQPLARPSDGLIVSPKRQLTIDKTVAAISVRTRLDDSVPPQANLQRPADYQAELPPERPAELFICRLFQIFKNLQRAYPRRVVVTYPTSYMKSELIRVVNTIYNAWRLAERFNPAGHASREEVIPLALDEATAAAFFYLAHFVLEGPGGLHTFRWLYPEGFYLLVYDCGGATTDISLVRAASPERGSLTFEVLGRTGLRDFGGDDITIAVFLLLKTKLAQQLASRSGRALKALPTVGAGSLNASKAAELRLCLQDEVFLRECDRFVPTDFDPQSVSSDVDARKALTLHLWNYAQAVKHGDRDAPALTESLAKALASVASVPESDLKKIVDGVSVTAAEIDALVRPYIQKSVKVCKALLQSKLHFRGGLVDDVFIIGNGSRYPLVTNLVRESVLGDSSTSGLATDAIGGSVNLDPVDIKHAVAKGAALALAMKESALGIRIQFDEGLSNRLPFTVAWFNAATRTHVILFEEGESYDTLEPRTIHVQPSPDGKPQQWIRLENQWPGGEYEPFLLFHFPHGVKGEVVISIDPDQHQFIAQCQDTGERAVGQRDIDRAVYFAPVQRGRIRLPKARD